MTRQEKYSELVKMELYPRKMPVHNILKEMSPMEFCAIGAFLEFENKNGGNHITVNRLAKDMGMSMPLTSRMLKNLETRGLIKRVTDEQCRRNTLIIISEKGNELFENNSKVVMKYIDKVLDNFSDEELETLISIKKKMMASMQDAMEFFE